MPEQPDLKMLAAVPRLLAFLLFLTRVIPSFQKVFFLLSAPFVNTSSKQDLKLLHGDLCAPGRPRESPQWQEGTRECCSGHGMHMLG